MVLEIEVAEMPMSYTIFFRLCSLLIQVFCAFIQDRFHCLNLAGEWRKLIIGLEGFLRLICISVKNPKRILSNYNYRRGLASLTQIAGVLIFQIQIFTRRIINEQAGTCY